MDRRDRHCFRRRQPITALGLAAPFQPHRRDREQVERDIVKRRCRSLLQFEFEFADRFLGVAGRCVDPAAIDCGLDAGTGCRSKVDFAPVDFGPELGDQSFDNVGGEKIAGFGCLRVGFGALDRVFPLAAGQPRAVRGRFDGLDEMPVAFAHAQHAAAAREGAVVGVEIGADELALGRPVAGHVLQGTTQRGQIGSPRSQFKLDLGRNNCLLGRGAQGSP